MTRRRCWSMFVVAVLAWPTIGQSLAQSRYIPENTIQLGNVRQGDVVEHRFMVRNPGSSPVKARIENLSHPGMKIRMPQEFAAESTGWITITWDTRPVQGETTVEAE